jgi:hypothetical protein
VDRLCCLAGGFGVTLTPEFGRQDEALPVLQGGATGIGTSGIQDRVGTTPLR